MAAKAPNGGRGAKGTGSNPKITARFFVRLGVSFGRKRSASNSSSIQRHAGATQTQRKTNKNETKVEEDDEEDEEEKGG